MIDYHSMFYRLLSWKNPRATGISFAAAVIFIFATRYLNVIRYIFKATWIVLGCTAAAEVAGQAALGKGITSQFRPRQYFTIPKASLERLLDDVEQLINFFVIESQRIVFAENIDDAVARAAEFYRSDSFPTLPRHFEQNYFSRLKRELEGEHVA